MTALAKASTELASVTSRGWATASPPAVRISSTISAHFSTRRAPSATGKPARARVSAAAAPIPDDAPLITAGRRAGWAYFALTAAERPSKPDT